MARREPADVAWLSITWEQRELVDTLDYVGNKCWARTSQTEAMMPQLLSKFEKGGLSLDRIKEAMMPIGYQS